MRTFLVLLAVSSACLFGQEKQKYSGDGYVYYGLDTPVGGGLTEAMTMGAGVDAILYKGIGLGLDLGYQYPRGYFRGGVGLLSVNGAYHLQNVLDRGRFVPFVTAGYGLAFREGHLNLYNFGGGATYWFHRRVGARFEVRDYRHSSYGQYASTVRFGVSFR